MRKKVLTLIVSWAILAPVVAQENTDIGGLFEAKLTKSLTKQWEVSLEEELRLKNNFTTYDRWVSTLSTEYSILPKRLKVGVLYAFQNVNNNDHLHQNRHRYSLSATLRQDIQKVKLGLRLRYQSTYRQEVNKAYKINPENYLRARLEAAYNLTHSRWEPSISAEMFYTLNNPYRNVIDRIRVELALDYRIDRRQYIAGTVRLDIPVQDKEPQTIIKIGIAYKFNW